MKSACSGAKAPSTLAAVSLHYLIAIKKRHPIHLEIQRHRKTPVGILRTTFRDPADGKVKHKQHGRLTGPPCLPAR
jgi:hypothetical protein